VTAQTARLEQARFCHPPHPHRSRARPANRRRQRRRFIRLPPTPQEEIGKNKGLRICAGDRTRRATAWRQTWRRSKAERHPRRLRQWHGGDQRRRVHVKSGRPHRRPDTISMVATPTLVQSGPGQLRPGHLPTSNFGSQKKLKARFRKNTRLVFLENADQPTLMELLRSPRRPHGLSHRHGLRWWSDNTFMSPYFQRSESKFGGRHGVHSTTKFLQRA